MQGVTPDDRDNMLKYMVKELAPTLKSVGKSDEDIRKYAENLERSAFDKTGGDQMKYSEMVTKFIQKLKIQALQLIDKQRAVLQQRQQQQQQRQQQGMVQPGLQANQMPQVNYVHVQHNAGNNMYTGGMVPQPQDAMKASQIQQPQQQHSGWHMPYAPQQQQQMQSQPQAGAYSMPGSTLQPPAAAGPSAPAAAAPAAEDAGGGDGFNDFLSGFLGGPAPPAEGGAVSSGVMQEQKPIMQQQPQQQEQKPVMLQQPITMQQQQQQQQDQKPIMLQQQDQKPVMLQPQQPGGMGATDFSQYRPVSQASYGSAAPQRPMGMSQQPQQQQLYTGSMQGAQAGMPQQQQQQQQQQGWMQQGGGAVGAQLPAAQFNMPYTSQPQAQLPLKYQQQPGKLPQPMMGNAGLPGQQQMYQQQPQQLMQQRQPQLQGMQQAGSGGMQQPLQASYAPSTQSQVSSFAPHQQQQQRQQGQQGQGVPGPQYPMLKQDGNFGSNAGLSNANMSSNTQFGYTHMQPRQQQQQQQQQPQDNMAMLQQQVAQQLRQGQQQQQLAALRPQVPITSAPMPINPQGQQSYAGLPQQQHQQAFGGQQLQQQQQNNSNMGLQQPLPQQQQQQWQQYGAAVPTGLHVTPEQMTLKYWEILDSQREAFLPDMLELQTFLAKPLPPDAPVASLERMEKSRATLAQMIRMLMSTRPADLSNPLNHKTTQDLVKLEKLRATCTKYTADSQKLKNSKKGLQLQQQQQQRPAPYSLQQQQPHQQQPQQQQQQQQQQYQNLQFQQPLQLPTPEDAYSRANTAAPSPLNAPSPLTAASPGLSSLLRGDQPTPPGTMPGAMAMKPDTPPGMLVAPAMLPPVQLRPQQQMQPQQQQVQHTQQQMQPQQQLQHNSLHQQSLGVANTATGNMASGAAVAVPAPSTDSAQTAAAAATGAAALTPLERLERLLATVPPPQLASAQQKVAWASSGDEVVPDTPPPGVLNPAPKHQPWQAGWVPAPVTSNTVCHCYVEGVTSTKGDVASDGQKATAAAVAASVAGDDGSYPPSADASAATSSGQGLAGGDADGVLASVRLLKRKRQEVEEECGRLDGDLGGHVRLRVAAAAGGAGGIDGVAVLVECVAGDAVVQQQEEKVMVQQQKEEDVVMQEGRVKQEEQQVKQEVTQQQQQQQQQEGQAWKRLCLAVPLAYPQEAPMAIFNASNAKFDGSKVLSPASEAAAEQAWLEFQAAAEERPAADIGGMARLWGQSVARVAAQQ